MITTVTVDGFRYFMICLTLPVLQVVFCSFNGKIAQPNISSEKINMTDTIPHPALHDIKWNKEDILFTANGVLIARLYNGDSIIIARKDYEDYARKNAKIDLSNSTFIKVEIEPEYPGGTNAWLMYVKENTRFSKVVIGNKSPSTVIVNFVVEQDGTLNEVQAVAGPTTGRLRDEAVRLIRTSGKWHAAIQNFRIVRAYKKQAVTFVSEKNR